jgi:photosystem II stability/assembly factor-like uncharacterized protein
MIKEAEFNLTLDNKEFESYWIYVNPLNGKYVKLISNNALAVFESEDACRNWENMSETLQNRVAHQETLNRIKEIADEQTDGQYVILS